MQYLNSSSVYAFEVSQPGYPHFAAKTRREISTAANTWLRSCGLFESAKACVEIAGTRGSMLEHNARIVSAAREINVRSRDIWDIMQMRACARAFSLIESVSFFDAECARHIFVETFEPRFLLEAEFGGGALPEWWISGYDHPHAPSAVRTHGPVLYAIRHVVARVLKEDPKFIVPDARGPFQPFPHPGCDLHPKNGFYTVKRQLGSGAGSSILHI